MEPDPFAVWGEDPSPKPGSAAASTSSAPTARSRLPESEEDKERLSFDIKDEDPGWGVPSASVSRANSPEKTRKAASNGSTKAVPPLSLPTSGASKPIPPAVAQDEPESGLGAQTTDEKVEEEEDAFEDSHQYHPTVEASGAKTQTSVTEVTEYASDAGKDDNDGFDDFDEPGLGTTEAGNHDDFGDFDDFEEGAVAGDDDFGDDGFGEAQPTAAAVETAPIATTAPQTQRSWSPLNVTTNSRRQDLFADVASLLPLSQAAEQELTRDGLRQVEGQAQVLVTGESRQLWLDLSSFPSVQPIDWVRSKTRRDYLISMGIPVNLDEIHSSFASGASSSQMPPLKLKLDPSVARVAGPSSAPIDGNNTGLMRSSSLHTPSSMAGAAGAAAASSPIQRSASASNSPRNGNSSPALGSSTNRERIAERRREELGLGPAPQVDLKRASELVAKTEDQLTLMSLPALRSMLRELNTLTTSTSSLLTHHLTLRESYQADSEMYNSMIKELVTGAASRISGSAGATSSGRNDPKRATTIGMSASQMAKNRSSMGAAAGNGTAAGRMSPSLRGGAGSSPRR